MRNIRRYFLQGLIVGFFVLLLVYTSRFIIMFICSFSTFFFISSLIDEIQRFKKPCYPRRLSSPHKIIYLLTHRRTNISQLVILYVDVYPDLEVLLSTLGRFRKGDPPQRLYLHYLSQYQICLVCLFHTANSVCSYGIISLSPYIKI